MKKLLPGVLSAVAIVLFAASVSVNAAPVVSNPKPVITNLSGPAVYVDDELCADEGFDVNVNGYDWAVEADYYDAHGNLTKTVYADRFVGTVTANGVTLNKNEDAIITLDWIAGTETWVGLAESYSYPHGRLIAADIGVVTFDADGNVVRELGPHPLTNGPGVVAVCHALGGV